MSLRIAIKRSLEVSPTKETKKRRHTTNNEYRPPHPAPVSVELPNIDSCIRNSDPSRIDEFGFVEITSALSEQLLTDIRQEAVYKVTRYQEGMTTNSPNSKALRRLSKEIEVISNSLQVDVSADLFTKISIEIQASNVARDVMNSVFGKEGPGGTASNYNGFVIETPKFLVTLPGSHPQLPHADDHCTSCIMGLIHLHDNQEPTLVATYDGMNKEYPTGITVSCNICSRTQMLPDRDYRRGVHLTDEEWTCFDCTAPIAPFNFEGSIVKTFGELLDEDALSLCHSYCGKKSVNAGDGMFTLPTLIHRGPGNPSTATENRYMLFFSLRPQYSNGTKTEEEMKHYHKYNPDFQIHAPCILFNQFKNVKSIYEKSGCNLEGYLSTIVGKKTAALMREVTSLKAEVKYLKETIRPAQIRDEN